MLQSSKIDTSGELSLQLVLRCGIRDCVAEVKNTAKVGGRFRGWNSVSILLLLALAAPFSAPSSAEIKLNLRDEILEKESDWAMYLDVQDVQQQLSTKQSTLYPLSKVRVSFRSFPRTDKTVAKDSSSKTYEELWYHKRIPVASRRYLEPVFPDESLGIIVLGPSDSKNNHIEDITNALIRLLVNLQFKKASTSVVFVPEKNYDQISAALNYYNFWADYKLSSGSRMSIHLCSNSSVREDHFFLGK